MHLKSAIFETICRNGRFLMSARAASNTSRFAVLPLRRGPVCCGTRSLVTLSKIFAYPEGTTGANHSLSSSFSDLLLYPTSRGLSEQLVRNSSTQASPAAETAEGEKPKGNIKTQVLFEELVSMVNSGKATLVDVREPDELQQTGNLPGCINIPLTKLKAALAMSGEEFTVAYRAPKLQKDDPNVIFYGLSSVKSSAAVEIAHKMGFKKSRHYPGGLEEWNQKYQKR